MTASNHVHSLSFGPAARFARAAARWVLWAAIALTLGLGGVARAGDGDYTVEEYTYRRLERAQKQLESKDYKGAFETLNQLLVRKRLSKYGRALTLQSMAYAYVKLENYPKAAETFQAMVDLEALPPQTQADSLFNLGQILMAVEKYRKAVSTFEQWLAMEESPSPSSLHTIATAYAQVKDYPKVVTFIKRAIRGKKKPPDQWYRLHLAALVQLKRWSAAIPVMLEIVERDLDDAKNWKQLSAIYSEAGRTGESVAVLELTYRLGLLDKPKDIRLLAQNLLAIDVPTKAAEYLEDALKKGRVKRDAETLELLATSYIAAADVKDAVGPLQQAARIKKSAKLFTELGQLHLERKEWAPAVRAFDRALSSGDAKKPGQVHLMKGIAQFRLGRKGAARKSFKAAGQFSDAKRSAQSWLGFLDES